VEMFRNQRLPLQASEVWKTTEQRSEQPPGVPDAWHKQQRPKLKKRQLLKYKQVRLGLHTVDLRAC
jgi:hypothetical protein